MDQLLREFLADAEDLIEALFRDIEALREKQAVGRARRELTGRIFRNVHTLKGTAAAAGLTIASQTAHEFETLLDAVRTGRMLLDNSVLPIFDDAAHALSQLLDAARRGETSQPPLQLLENLRSLTQTNDAPHPSRQASTNALLPEDIARSLSAEENHRVCEAAAEGRSLFVIHVAFELETFDRHFRELGVQLGERGELFSTLPGLSEAAPGAISLRLLYASGERAEELSALASAFASVSIEELKPASVPHLSEKAAGEFDEETNADRAFAEAIAPLPTQVRVELGKLDELISATHELMAETRAALDLALEESEAGGGRDSVAAHASRIHSRFIELEEQLIGLRRVPLARALERAARAGRLAARATGKEVAFEITGGEVRLDKSLVDAVSDPLLHLVRNAVDHGIEPPQTRMSVGKNRQGLVRLEAAAEGDRVILKITDDGRGIELEGISRAAVKHGIIAAGQSMSRHQALRLIFRPGFSTASTISEVSGRGVGLDVVERAVEQVGGEMHVRSETNQGATFEMIVPVAIALMSARVFGSAGFSYCVDAGKVCATCFVEAENVSREQGRELIDWRGARLPLVRLRELLGQPAIAEGSVESWPVVIVSTAAKETGEAAGEGGHRVALAVDEWREGREEVLVRRLGAQGVRWQGVSGAAELSDGRLALVLDLPRLLETHDDGS